MSNVRKTFEYAGELLERWEKNHVTHCARMRAVYEQAQCAAREGEVPVAASLWRGDTMLAAARNRVRTLSDPMMHAEYIVVRNAIEMHGLQYLEDCILYVTLAPCPMCWGVINRVRLGELCYAASTPEEKPPSGAFPRYVFGGVLQKEC